MDAEMKFKMVERIMATEDEALLNEVRSLLGLSGHDFWDDLSDSTKASIQKGLDQSHRGETTTHEEVMTKIRSRFLKS